MENGNEEKCEKISSTRESEYTFFTYPLFNLCNDLLFFLFFYTTQPGGGEGLFYQRHSWISTDFNTYSYWMVKCQEMISHVPHDLQTFGGKIQIKFVRMRNNNPYHAIR